MTTTKTKAVEVVQQPTFTETLKIALYGKFGSRKTLQIGTLIELVGADNVLIVSAEHGLNTIRSTLTNTANIIDVASLADVRKAWSVAQEFANTNRWVALDGMSQITEWIANEQLSGADRYYELKQQGLNIAPDDLKYGRFIQRGEINTMAVYGKVGRESENLIAAWIKLPVNLYANYLEDMTGVSGFEKSVPYGPDVPGRVGLKAVMSSFDYVGRLTYNERNELVAGFDATSALYMARTREDRNIIELPKTFTNFKLSEFVQLVGGKGVADAAAS